MSKINKNIKRKLLGLKNTKKTSLWKGRGEVVSNIMKIDKQEKNSEEGVRRPKVPSKALGENIDKALKYGTIAAKVLTRSGPHVIAYTAGQEAMGLLTGKKKPDPKSITGSRTLDVIAHPAPLMYKATKEYVKQRKNLKKGIFKDPFAGDIRTRS